MEMKELYEKIEEIGCLSFSTVNNKGEVHSRIAHFNGYDDDGLYFRTMVTKPYYRQLIATEKLTVCGITDSSIEESEDGHSPVFEPSFTLRLIGNIKNISDEEIIEKSKSNKMLLTAVNDMEKYPAMKGGNFVMHSAKGEIYDVDFELVSRDNKLNRYRFSFGGVEFNQAGPKINDKCISCGLCHKACSFKAINEDGAKYIINPNRCDDCGDCRNACKFDAIDESLEF